MEQCVTQWVKPEHPLQSLFHCWVTFVALFMKVSLCWLILINTDLDLNGRKKVIEMGRQACLTELHTAQPRQALIV